MKTKFLSKCKMSILRILSSFLVAICLLPIVPVMAATDTELSKNAEVVAESTDVIMYYDAKTGMISLKYKDSGRIINTKVVDGDSGNKTYKNYQKSDFVIYYYKEPKSTSTSTIDNFSLSIDLDQVEYQKIEQGIKLVYTLKEDKLSIDILPKYIGQEKMETMILDNLTKAQKEKVLELYRFYKDSYVRTKDGGLTQSAIRDMQTIFYEVCGYTEDDLEADNAAGGYVSEYVNLEIHMSIEYVLDGKDLLVRVPVNEYYCNLEESILNSFSVLPYFLSSTTEEEGYIVVPDGSGAVIEFNNEMTNSVDYVSRVFGKDTLIDTKKFDTTEYYANMPIIGMVYEDYAYLAIVEEGAALAEINTQISGKNDNYNKAYFKFYIQEMENVAAMESSAISINKYTGDAFNETIVIRYQMLEEEEANYTGIAKNYQQYLINTGALTKAEVEDNASLFLDVLGTTKESKNFLGIPYQGMASLTTFAETKSMMEFFAAANVKDMDVQLTGWANKGENHTDATKIKIESNMGSKKQLNALAAYAESNGYSFYPTLNLQTVYAAKSSASKRATSSFAGKYASKLLSMEYAQIGKAQLGLDAIRINDYSGYLVSPNKLATYVEKALAQMNKLSVKGIAARDLGSLLVADYSTKESEAMNREKAADVENAVIGTIKENYEVLLSNPYSYAWQYASAISDLPSRSNEFNVFSYDVPLLQLVLDGCKSYSTTALNNDTQKSNQEMLLKCIETRMNPKFMLMQAEMTDLTYTEEYFDLLSVNFDDWKDRIVEIYNEYNAFYQMVKGAEIENHETLYKNVVKVTYTNGVTVYVNYAKRPYMVDGNIIAASSYLIENN